MFQQHQSSSLERALPEEAPRDEPDFHFIPLPAYCLFRRPASGEILATSQSAGLPAS